MSHTVLNYDEARQALVDAGIPLVCNIDQAQEALGLSKQTLRRRVRSGELRRLKSREKRGGRLLFLRDDLARLLATMSG